MAYLPDWSSESEDSIFGDDGGYIDFKDHMKQSRDTPRELSEEEKKTQQLRIFHDAVNMGQKTTVEDMVSTGFDVHSDLGDGWTGFMLAATSGNSEMVELLIKLGADVNKSRDGETPLMMACNCPDYIAPFDKSLETINLLIDNGADVQIINRKRMNALMYAASNGNLQAVQLLLPMSIKDAVDNQRWTALTWAVNCNRPDTVQFLLDMELDCHLVDVKGNTLVDIARENGFCEILDILAPDEDTDIIIPTNLPFGQHFDNLHSNEHPQFFEDVCSILTSVRCEDLIPLFNDKKVSLNQLLSMDEGDLRELGVSMPLKRYLILNGLHRFHRMSYNPKSVWVCINKPEFSNVDAATMCLSAVKQIEAMEASLKYLLKHYNGEAVTKEEEQILKRLEAKFNGLKSIAKVGDSVTKQWDVAVEPADLITRNSIKSRIPWIKISFCLGVSVILVCRYKRFEFLTLLGQ